jgi:exopolysaccharide production protein ExoQ
MLKMFDTAFAVFGMFYMCEGFAAVLASAPGLEEAGETGSPAIRILGILIGLIAVMRVLMDANAALRVMVRSWPIWVPVGVALVSMLWSGDPGLTVRRSAALLLTTVFALFIVTRFDARAIFNLLMVALLAYCVGSLLMIFLVPSIGVHSAADTRFFEHVGAWRGLSAFKNDFGRLVAMAGVVFIVAAVARAHRRELYVVAALLAMALTAGSRSGQAVALFGISLVATFYVILLQRLSLKVRSALIFLTLPVLVFVGLVQDIVVSFVLEALGKDPTLTGRMNIWPAVLTAMQNNLLLGGGYGAGWGFLVNDYMQEVLGRQIGHAHNGYLNLIVDLGIVGLTLMLGFLSAVGYRVYVNLVTGRNWEFVLLASTVLVFTIAGNWVGSFLLKHNSIFWVLLVCFYCKLGEAYGMQGRPANGAARRLGPTNLTAIKPAALR